MISYFSEDTTFLPSRQPQLSTWLSQVAQEEEHHIKELNYIFCSDKYLLQINKKYLEHDYYTDIITFDNGEDEQVIEGDVFISIDRVKDNAVEFSVSFDQELWRVMVHGLLHLMGYKDHTVAEKQLMRKKEEAYLSLQKQITG